MHDDKRMLRKLKREVKRRGNKQRRRFLKDVDADADRFDFGRNCSQSLNDHRHDEDEPEQ